MINEQEVKRLARLILQYEGSSGPGADENYVTDAQLAALHAAVTISAPLSLSGQAITLVNDTAATVTEIDTGVLANSDTVIPTSKAVSTAIAGVSVGSAWPVGSVFISVVNTNPATLIGVGTWAAFGTGKVLVGIDTGDANFNVVEETGGAKTVASSTQTFAGDALATHQHAAVTAGTPAGTNEAEAAHTHTYTQVVNHVHAMTNLLARSSATGAASTLVNAIPDTTGTIAGPYNTDNPTGGAGATGTTAAGSSHNHAFTGSELATHQHAAITAGTPSGSNTPGAATSVVQPYIVVYMWKRTA